MIAPWLFFALFTPALYAVANYCDKVLLDHFRIKPIELCGLVYIGFAVCSLGLAVCGDGPVAPLGAGLLPFFTGVLFTLYALPYYRALMLDEASVIIPLFQFSPLFVIAFEVALMGIRLSPEQVLGTVLILVCGFACAVERDSERIFRVRPALWYMLLAGALYAASGPLMSFGLKENSLISFLFYQGLGMLLTGIVLYLYGRERAVGDRPRTSGLFWGILTLNCVVATVALVGAIRAVDEVAVSLVRVVEASQPIFVFVLGALLTQLYPTYVNERISRRIVLKKLLIGVGMIVGAFFLQKM